MSEMGEMSEIYNSLHQCTTEYNCCKSLALGEALWVPECITIPLPIAGEWLCFEFEWVCFECKMPSHTS